ncbi:MAG: PLP-dependent aminotransferase family protein [Dehalococcoidia bacterium]|nr:PLP-dependent aminotransferase family protein [Dehalococcoidia bacterium]
MPVPTFDPLSLAAPAALRGLAPYPFPMPGPIINFRGGVPDPVTFPLRDLADAAQRVLRDDPTALQYGYTSAYQRLSDYLISRYARDDGRTLNPDQISINAGAGQAIALACTAFVAPGDAVILEAPTFAWALRIWKMHDAHTTGIPVDGDGLQTDALETKLRQLRSEGRPIKLLYTVPSFHNPTGAVLSAGRRRRLLALAAEYGFLILEDNTYREFRFEGDLPPSLFAQDAGGRVVSIGTFSKIIAPGVRIGWAAGHPDVVRALAAVRGDLGASPWMAGVVADYASSGKLDAHIRDIVPLYHAKRDRIVASLSERCAPYLRWRTPPGGFFIWVTIADGIDPTKLAAAAELEGISYSAGHLYMADASARNTFRLSYSHLSLAEIDRGIAALGRALARCAP